MLFPGAIYILGPVAILVAIAFSMAVGFVIGAAIYYLGGIIIRRTKTHHDMQIGLVPYNKKAWPRWTNQPIWFGLGWLWGFIIVLYAVSGPVWSLLTNMGGM